VNRHDKITDETAERLLREAAVQEGASLPKTAHELEIMKESDQSEVEIPDFRRVLERIRGEHPAANKVVEFTPATDRAVTEELAMAARNGSEIPEEIRRRMNADREAAKGQQDELKRG
jgi:hypothetical protein